jgi:hypothetical protein
VLSNILSVFVHPTLWIRKWLEAKLGIQTMRVSSGEHKASQALQVGVFMHCLHQLFADTLPTKCLENHHIAQVRKNRVIRDHPSKANQSFARFGKPQNSANAPDF